MDLGTGNVGIGTAGPARKLDVSGEVNAARYEIGGSTVVAILPGAGNLGIGVNAGRVNTGDYNIFVGRDAGYENTTGGYNAFVGSHAGYNNRGERNAFVGALAGYNNSTGERNSFVGTSAGRYTATGSANAIFGNEAGGFNDGVGSGSFSSSTIMGARAGNKLTDGAADNIFVGFQAGYKVTTGTRNIVIGYDKDTSAPGAGNELNIGGVLYGDLAAKTVGISTRAPAAALDIVSTGTAADQMAQIWRDSEGVVKGSMSATGVMMASKFIGDGSGLTGIAGDNLGSHIATQNIQLGSHWLSGDGGNEGAAIDAAGNVGIGEMSPGSKLSVSGGAAIGAGYDTTLAPGDGLIIEGSVGIGTAWPAAKLMVNTTDVTTVPLEIDGLGPQLSGWPYRKPITISNSGSALTDYPVKVTVVFVAGHMNSDFSDIRFMHADGITQLDHWRESYTPSVTADFWVKGLSIPAGSSTIYVYYGNTLAASVSDETKVFYTTNGNFDIAPAGNGWTYTGGGHNWSLTSGDTHSAPYSAYLQYIIGGCTEGYIYQDLVIPNTAADLYLDFWDRVTGDSWNNTIGIMFNDVWLHSHGNGVSHGWEQQAVNINAYKGQSVRLKIYHTDGPPYCGIYDHDANMNADDFRLRQHASPEPTPNVGAEETTSPPITKPFLYIQNNTGNVGIGKVTPATTLDVAGAVTATSFSGGGGGLTGTAASLSIGGNAATATSANTATNIAGGGAGAIPFQTGAGATTFDASNLYWDNANKRVGIGTAGPGAALEVAGQVKITGGTPGAGKVLISDGVGLASWGTASGDNLGNHTATLALNMSNNAVDNVSSVTITGTGVTGSDPLFKVAGSTMVVLNNGNVGIGTTGPQEHLHIYGSDVQRLKIESSDTNAAVLKLTNSEGSLGVYSDDAAFGVYDYTAGQHRLVIDTTGKVGIGIMGPGARLDIQETNTANSYSLRVGTSATAYHLAVSTTGSVGIGTTGPEYKLDVNGNLRAALSLTAGLNVETLAADKTLVPGTDKMYQYLNPDAANRIITLATAGAGQGDRFIIRNNGVFDTNYYLQLNQGAVVLDKAYSGAVKEFVFDGTNWVSGSTGSGEEDGKSKNVAIGSNARGYGYGAAVGHYSNGNSSGAALGDYAAGYDWGAAVGANAQGYSYGAAVGRDTVGNSYGAAVGYYAKGYSFGAAVGSSAYGYTSGAAVGTNALGYSYGAAVGYNARGLRYGAAIGYQAGKNIDDTADRYNTLVGAYSGYQVTTGTGNIILGYKAGYDAAYSPTTGSKNILIGSQAGTPANATSNFLNIGNLIFAAGVNTATGAGISTGSVGIGTADPQAALDIVSTGTTVNDYAQIWRNSAGTIVSSMTATGVLYPQAAGGSTGPEIAVSTINAAATTPYGGVNITTNTYVGGRLGVGLTNPSAGLHVQSYAAGAGTLYVSTSATAGQYSIAVSSTGVTNINNMVIENRTSDPVNPVVGQVWFRVD